MERILWKLIKLAREGPMISHIFFTDDLVLFVEASMEQINIIMSCLSSFCLYFREKVNVVKTRICFSRNVNHTVASKISSTSVFNLTNDLGKYLGLPSHHNQVCKSTYHFVVGKKMQAKFSVQKAKHLSLEGRIALDLDSKHDHLVLYENYLLPLRIYGQMGKNDKELYLELP